MGVFLEMEKTQISKEFTGYMGEGGVIRVMHVVRKVVGLAYQRETDLSIQNPTL